MTTPIKDKAKEPMREENIERIRNMTLKIRSSLLDLETCYRNDISTSDLEDFRSSLGNIESKTSTAYSDLVARRATNSDPQQAGLTMKPKAASTKAGPIGKWKTRTPRRAKT